MCILNHNLHFISLPTSVGLRWLIDKLLLAFCFGSAGGQIYHVSWDRFVYRWIPGHSLFLRNDSLMWVEYMFSLEFFCLLVGLLFFLVISWKFHTWSSLGPCYDCSQFLTRPNPLQQVLMWTLPTMKKTRDIQ